MITLAKDAPCDELIPKPAPEIFGKYKTFSWFPGGSFKRVLDGNWCDFLAFDSDCGRTEPWKRVAGDHLSSGAQLFSGAAIIYSVYICTYI